MKCLLKIAICWRCIIKSTFLETNVEKSFVKIFTMCSSLTSFINTSVEAFSRSAEMVERMIADRDVSGVRCARRK